MEIETESPDNLSELVPRDTPEDVAVLYSWANLQGAKYRDFSAARREYRAQVRLKAAEDHRLDEARAQAEAEAAALEAEAAAREAEEAARFHETAARRAAQAQQRKEQDVEQEARERALRQAEHMSRIAASERLEASRRAEAVAAAEVAARREAREMEEARASAERQAAQYRDSEVRGRDLSQLHRAAVPGQISDPYSGGTQQVLPGRIFHQPAVPEDDMMPSRHPQTRDARLIVPQPDPRAGGAPVEREYLATGTLAEDAAIAARGGRAIAEAADRPNSPVRHYSEQAASELAKIRQNSGASVAARTRSDRQSGESSVSVRTSAPSALAGPMSDPMARPVRPSPELHTTSSAESRAVVAAAVAKTPSLAPPIAANPAASSSPSIDSSLPRRRRPSVAPMPMEETYSSPTIVVASAAALPQVPAAPVDAHTEPRPNTPVQSTQPASRERSRQHSDPGAPRPSSVESSSFAVFPLHTVPLGRRVQQDDVSPSHRAYAVAQAEAVAKAEAAQSAARRRGYAPDEASGFFSSYGSARTPPAVPTPVAAVEAENAVPEWLNDSAVLEAAPVSDSPRISSGRRAVAVAQPLPAEALQHSRERVAARWFALKGIFEHGEEQRADKEAKREKSTQPPMLSVFSLAGGVGKTSLVAALGRALSGAGEKVLLTDTTSHGLLPFYFGASELKPGVMRTFSPPSGSSDAALCLLSYDVLQKSGDQSSQDWLGEELARNSEGMARVVLDLSAASPWVARKMASMDSTILVPLAPDMNSVISLGAIEKFFSGMRDSRDKQVEPFYVLNQFDPSLALHLDVREVMRRQLDDRLLPFVIRRAPAVPEALAEGMTVMDYSPESAIAEDYRNLASWLRARSAPATTGQKHARWSER